MNKKVKSTCNFSESLFDGTGAMSKKRFEKFVEKIQDEAPPQKDEEMPDLEEL